MFRGIVVYRGVLGCSGVPVFRGVQVFLVLVYALTVQPFTQLREQFMENSRKGKIHKLHDNKAY